MSKYHKVIKVVTENDLTEYSYFFEDVPEDFAVEVEVDVYDVLLAYSVTCPAMAHAIKKMLMAGQRGAKNETQDKLEAIDSIKRSIELQRD